MKKDKPKLHFKDSLKYLLTNKYMLLMAVIVISYGMCINLIEVTWKSQLRLQYPNSNDYSTFMGNFSRITGIVSVLVMFFVTGNVVRRLGWKIAAIITPIVLILTGTGFFSFMIFRDSLSGFVALFSTTPLMLAVMFGAAQNITSKSSKYALFDPTKEMLYIPLNQEEKVKGKAAIDVVGARLGKSGGSLIQTVLIIGLGSISAMAPYVAVFLLIIISAWLLAVIVIAKLFKSKIEEGDTQIESSSNTTAKPGGSHETNSSEA